MKTGRTHNVRLIFRAYKQQLYKQPTHLPKINHVTNQLSMPVCGDIISQYQNRSSLLMRLLQKAIQQIKNKQNVKLSKSSKTWKSSQIRRVMGTWPNINLTLIQRQRFSKSFSSKWLPPPGISFQYTWHFVFFSWEKEGGNLRRFSNLRTISGSFRCFEFRSADRIASSDDDTASQ